MPHIKIFITEVKEFLLAIVRLACKSIIVVLFIGLQWVQMNYFFTWQKCPNSCSHVLTTGKRDIRWLYDNLNLIIVSPSEKWVDNSYIHYSWASLHSCTIYIYVSLLWHRKSYITITIKSWRTTDSTCILGWKIIQTLIHLRT